MRRFKPIYGILAVAVFTLAVVFANYAFTGIGYGDYERIRPDRDGSVKIDISDLEPRQVRFFRYLNAGNQEVKFFVGRDEDGVVQVAFDASETDYKRKRGFKHQGEWMVNNKCETARRLREVNSGAGGCSPVPLGHRIQGETLLLSEPDVLAGWRFFR